MTRKHYQLIADALRRTYPAPFRSGVTREQDLAQHKQWHLMVSALCKAFVDDSALFDPVRFVQAALPPSDE